MENETENRETGNGERDQAPPGNETETLKTRVGELERSLEEKDTEIATLKLNFRELEEKAGAFGTSLTEAVGEYTRMVIENNPSIPRELIRGDSIAAVKESFENARSLVSRVKQDIEAEMQRTKVPAGAPERTFPDLSDLTPGEKIRYALGGNR